MLKVLHLLDSTNIGGAETLLLDVCRNSERNGLDLSLVAFSGGDLESDFKNSGVKFIRFQRRLPLDPALIFQIRKIILGRKVQIIHAHQAVEGIHAYLASRGTGTKCVLTFHGHIPSKKNDAVLRFLIPRVDANITVSRGFLDYLKNKAGFNISYNFHVIHNGIDPIKFKPVECTKDFGIEIGLSKGTFLLGMIANFVDQKDQFTICQALPDLFRKFPKACFVFVGAQSKSNPSLFDRCLEYCQKTKITDRVIFVGKRIDVFNILCSLDMFVFSSLEDSFGIAAAEAMMVGVPTVLSDIPPLREICNNGEYARLFKTEDPKDLIEKVSELLENNDARLELGEQGRSWANNQFSINRHIERLRSLYDDLLSRV